MNLTTTLIVAPLYKWKLNEYGTANGIDIPLTKKGKTYKLKLMEDTPGAYRYDITFWPSKKEDIQETNDDGSVSYHFYFFYLPRV